MDRVAIMLSVSDELRLAYRLKKLFNDVMASKTRRHFKARYMWFKQEAEEYEIEEVMKHIATFDKWIKEIERSCVIGVTNGFIEGCNNRTKVLKRISYGFRNFNRFRNRLLCIANNTEIQKRRRHKLTS
jgi:transposase